MTDWQKQFENLRDKADKVEPIKIEECSARSTGQQAKPTRTRNQRPGDDDLGSLFPARARPKRSMTSSRKRGSLVRADAEVKASFSDDWAEAPISADFWVKFWEAVAGPSEGYDALTITQAIAALGGAVDESFGPLAEQCANAHPGADDAAEKTVPGLLDLQALSECPAGSLATSSIGCSLRMALTLRC